MQESNMKERKPYRCHHCSKAFANSSYLNQHTRIHAGIKPYNCTLCQRKFTQLSHLQQHLRTHTGDKPYKCNNPGCGKAFTQLSSLQSHSRCHNTNKPYKCNSCYKCFEDEKSLREHIPKHKNSKHSKTHLCLFCGKSYTQEVYLTRHITKHKSNNPLTDLFVSISTIDDQCQKYFPEHVLSTNTVSGSNNNQIDFAITGPFDTPASTLSAKNYVTTHIPEYESSSAPQLDNDVFDRLRPPSPTSMTRLDIQNPVYHMTQGSVDQSNSLSKRSSQMVERNCSKKCSHKYHNQLFLSDFGEGICSLEDIITSTNNYQEPSSSSQFVNVTSNEFSGITNPYHALFPLYDQLFSPNPPPTYPSHPPINPEIPLSQTTNFSFSVSLTPESWKDFNVPVRNSNVETTFFSSNHNIHSKNRKYYS